MSQSDFSEEKGDGRKKFEKRQQEDERKEREKDASLTISLSV